MAPARTYSVHSVERALRILQVLAHTPGATLSQVARAVAAPRTTALMILSTMCGAGFVERLPDSTYRLGSALYGILFRSPFVQAFARVAEPLLAELSAETGLTAHLAVRDGADSVYIAKADGPGLVKFNTRVGQRHALYLSGVGKALLMGADDADIAALFSPAEFVPLTPRTVPDTARLLEEVRAARRRGYAIEDEEEELGVRCLGVPVVDFRGITLGSVSVTGLTTQLAPERYDGVAARMRDTVRGIAAALAQGPPEAGAAAGRVCESVPEG